MIPMNRHRVLPMTLTQARILSTAKALVPKKRVFISICPQPWPRPVRSLAVGAGR
ncbi:hypothetical protein SAMN05421721_102175 [Ectothiorhodospira mobilis]|uniref:Uncharacterized protein n=1 Tax=Ectothiorhodospira mobilis TaxID=195064 RepID=A0A1I4PR67_ECTMO|nr:hypothetical protein SAMN05421721_102175 [Ectothiorhodospira mobilis]